MTATALLLARPYSLRKLHHSSSVSLLKWILELALSHTPQYLRGLPDRVLDCAIYSEHEANKQKFTDCYDFTTCEIIE